MSSLEPHFRRLLCSRSPRLAAVRRHSKNHLRTCQLEGRRAEALTGLQMLGRRRKGQLLLPHLMPSTQIQKPRGGSWMRHKRTEHRHLREVQDQEQLQEGTFTI